MRTRLRTLVWAIAIITTVALWAGSLYLAYLSGLAMNDIVGTTLESQDLQVLGGLTGFLAILMLGVLVLLSEHRALFGVMKAGFTMIVAFAIHVVASLVLQSCAAP